MKEDKIKEIIIIALTKVSAEHNLSKSELEYIATFISAMARSNFKDRKFLYKTMFEAGKEMKKGLSRQIKAAEEMLSKNKKKVLN